ncbi:MAG TPA: AfsR/SARP family transcriptional regulator [Streptosporangiaceae bacterium]|jgi:DNA-binding SARP family transcriptional activator
MTADLRFALLGPVRAWHGDTELDLGAPQQRSVLAALLLAEGRQVPIGALIDGLWAADPPRTAAGTVRTYVSRLRRVLGRATGAGLGRETDGLIESAGDGYLLTRDGFGLDLDTFVLLTGRARASHADPAQAARLLRQALALWQGEPLAGLPGRYAESQRDRLAELRMTALEERLALDIELGGHGAAAAELPGLLAGDPLRERLTELLMLALYRSGRQADALAAFGVTQRRLADDLGIDPGPALRALHGRILRMDASLDAPPPAAPVSVLTPMAAGHRPRRHQSGLRWCARAGRGRVARVAHPVARPVAPVVPVVPVAPVPEMRAG